MSSKYHLPALISILSLAVTCYTNSSALAGPRHELQANPVAEGWVRERVAAGDLANLKERFPNEADRVLSASFIERLLTDRLSDLRMPRHGVRIAYGAVVGSVDLEDAEIDHEAHLIGIRFEDDLNFSRSTFLKGLSLAESSFKKANFNRMKVNGDFAADGAQFTSPTLGADFEGMKVGGTVSLRQTVFAGPADFHRADVGGDFVADGAQFTNTEQTAEFRGLRVGGDVLLLKAVFAGSVSFLNADIGGNFEADGAQFTNATGTPSFEIMKVGGWVLFPEAIFAGGVDFRVASIGANGSNLVLDGARFTNSEREATFNSMKVGGAADFHGTSFAGPVDLLPPMWGLLRRKAPDSATQSSTHGSTA